MTIDKAIGLARKELERAQQRFPPFHSHHEGYAVIREEMDELWDEIKQSKSLRAAKLVRLEAVQVAAMALRFLVNLQ